MFYGEILVMSSILTNLIGNNASVSGTSATFSPLYQQIKALITQSLQSGEWKPGELIPSEVELANRFKVSQGTVRKAIDELAAENLVMRRQGKGTFVATHHEARAAVPVPAADAGCRRSRISPTARSSKSSACARRPKWRACWK